MFKRSKTIFYVASLLLLIFMLSACGNNESGSEDNQTDSNSEIEEEVIETEENTERVLTDALGNEVTIPENTERVIASYLEDHLVALGITPVAQWSGQDGQSVQDYLQDYLSEVDTIPSELPFEAVSSFEPDLLIMSSAAVVEGGKYEQYAKIAPTYVIAEETNDNWRENLQRIAEVFGEEEKADQVLTAYEEKAEESKELIKEAIGDESAAAIWLVGGNFYVVSENVSSGAVLYEDLDITAPEVVKEISSTATGNWSTISLEKLAELDADHLFLINSDIGNGAEVLQEPLWQNIPAVQNGNLYEYPANTSWLYSGPIANEQMIDAVLESLVK